MGFGRKTITFFQSPVIPLLLLSRVQLITLLLASAINFGNYVIMRNSCFPNPAIYSFSSYKFLFYVDGGERTLFIYSVVTSSYFVDGDLLFGITLLI